MCSILKFASQNIKVYVSLRFQNALYSQSSLKLRTFNGNVRSVLILYDEHRRQEPAVPLEYIICRKSRSTLVSNLSSKIINSAVMIFCIRRIDISFIQYTIFARQNIGALKFDQSFGLALCLAFICLQRLNGILNNIFCFNYSKIK